VSLSRELNEVLLNFSASEEGGVNSTLVMSNLSSSLVTL